MTQRIVIEPYDPGWPQRYAREARRIRESLGDVAQRVEHVGSTAVPGLAAKPIVDVQISVVRLEPHVAWREPLEALDYVHVTDADDATYPFLHRPETWPHEFHVHVCVSGGPEERRHLAFRDHLRAHDDEARAYAELKRSLARRFDADSFESRNAYADAKSDFIEARLQLALDEG